MHEIEIKAHIQDIDDMQERLSRIADFSYHTVKDDTYWTCGEKTLRIRHEYSASTKKVLVTHKRKHYTGMIETNKELEFELIASTVPVFTAILESLGMTLTAKKYKDTKVYIPHADLFPARILEDILSMSAELSTIPPIGNFLEIEILYQDEGTDAALRQKHTDNARSIFDTLLAALHIPQQALEMRPYHQLMKEQPVTHS